MSEHVYGPLKGHKVLLENDRVRALEVRIKPGERTGMHSHPASVVYALGPAKVTFAFPDGTSRDVDIHTGDIAWSNPLSHDVINIGKTDDVGIIVELKERRAAPRPCALSRGWDAGNARSCAVRLPRAGSGHDVDIWRRRGTMARKYGRKSQQAVKSAMERRKSGTLRSGRSGKKVTSRKQAVAIGLSEARKKGARVPPRPKSSSKNSSRSKRSRSKSR